MTSLELLAPAKNLEAGIAAIDHGADAVYIGAPRHGARAAAGNSVDDIAALCRHAHQFGAKVHVTVNTIIYDSEMADTLSMTDELTGVGVDALLVQDMGLLAELRKRNLRATVLHASTQCDTRSAEKVGWLHSIGFRRAVLARELSLREIAAIHQAVPKMELEVFVHGALCVSYSGACYASQYAFGRSANRGECAQMCRMKYSLVDDIGREIEHERYLLSLKDLCQLDRLEELAEAGACSFKIEGRLKDVGYVKNVVAAYSQRLDEIVRRHPDRYRRASNGTCSLTFAPNLQKTFNRGYTHYFLDGRQPDIFSPDTPKAIGEYVGRVKELRRDSIVVAGTAAFANGDGLCFINDERELEGFRVNRAAGNALYPYRLPRSLRRGTPLYRNNDQAFEHLLAGQTAERHLPLDLHFEAIDGGFALTARLGDGTQATATVPFAHQEAQRPQRDNIVRQLSRLGGTIYTPGSITLAEGSDRFFLPNSLLAELRRKVVEALREERGVGREERGVGREEREMGTEERGERREEREMFCGQEAGRNLGGKEAGRFDNKEKREKRKEEIAEEAHAKDMEQQSCSLSPLPSPLSSRPSTLSPLPSPLSSIPPFSPQQAPFQLNIANAAARAFYEEQGIHSSAPAYELEPPRHALLMQCRHCLRFSLGYCVKRGGAKPTWREPLHLVLGDGRRFRLEFACNQCQMNVYAET